MDPKQARNALIQFALWGIALVVIGGSIAAATWPHTDGVGRYSGDEAGFWFGVVIAWLGTLLVIVPVVAWAAKLGREAWPAPPPPGSAVEPWLSGERHDPHGRVARPAGRPSRRP